MSISSGSKTGTVNLLSGVLLYLAVFMPGYLSAQEVPVLDPLPTVACKDNCDVVSGRVYDSLAGEYLEGALVVAHPSGASTLTDSTGRFEISSGAKVEQLVAYHDVLDATGLGAIVSHRSDASRPWKNVSLTTPSIKTLWPRLCDRSMPSSARNVILMGSSRMADDRTRVAGAKIYVQWPRPPYSVGGDDFRTMETVTDSIGGFVICGVEDYVEPSLVALSNEASSSIITLPSDNRPLRKIDIVLGKAEGGSSAFSGSVVDEKGSPLSGITVEIDGYDGSVSTSQNGTFSIPSVPHGSRMLNLRAVGYTPIAQVVDVLESDSQNIVIPMSQTLEIEGVTITASSTVRRDRMEFELRKRYGLGRFVDSTEISRAPLVRNALAMVPGINVSAAKAKEGASTDFEIRGRRDCSAIIWVDGVMDFDGLANRLPKDQIAAIEVYPSTALAPGRYVRVMADDCPVVLFWTHNGLRP